ncbi:unnamed protein product [Blepharisma stoltei]|uniref:Uncharacterized protein n=1 Tax=Blepharisma stoltei TaxID=1481888 RepID=A0AAU9JIF3_9CILI|nr:unnamed protein product [Blepharisma stoltei]
MNKCKSCQRLTLRKCRECRYICESHSLDCNAKGHVMNSDLNYADQSNLKKLEDSLQEAIRKIESDMKKVKEEGIRLINYAQRIVFEAELSLDALRRRFSCHLKDILDFKQRVRNISENDENIGLFVLDDIYLKMIKDPAAYSSFIEDLYKFEFNEEIYKYKIFEISSLWDEKFQNIEQRELKKSQELLSGFKAPIEKIRGFLDEMKLEEGPFQNVLLECLYLNSHGKIHEYLSMEEFLKDIDQDDPEGKKRKDTNPETLKIFFKNENEEEQKHEDTVFESVLKLNSEITQINMKQYPHIQAYGSWILGSLKVLPNLKHLNLENTDLSHNFQQIVNGMGKLVNLEILNLGSCNINEDRAIIFSEIMPNFRNLTHLYLSHNEIKNNVGYIVKNIVKPQKMVYLDLSFNSIAEGYFDISDALLKMANLEYLHLGGNNIKNGLNEIADSFLSCNSLFQAQFSNIDFLDEIYAHVADGISNLKYLKVLRLANLGEEHERRFKRSHTDCLVYREKMNPNDNTHEVLLVR